MLVLLWLLMLYTHQMCCIRYAVELIGLKQKKIADLKRLYGSLVSHWAGKRQIASSHLYADDIFIGH